MSKSNVWETDLLKLVFNNDAAAGIGDAGGLRGSVTAGNLYLRLHTADPGEVGTQATNETTYTGYAAMAVPRTAAGFTVSGNGVNLTTAVEFGECTANPGVPITHISIGDDPTGAGKIRYKGTLTPNIAMAVGTAPRIKTTANLVTED